MSSTAKKIITPAAPQAPTVKPNIVRNSKPKAAPAAQPKLSVVTSDKFEAKHNATLAGALNKSRSAAFVCDLEWNISFANDRALETLHEMESALQSAGGDWRAFSADATVGENFEFLFSDEPQEFKKATEGRHHPYTKHIQVGPFTCDLYVDSIEDESGNLTGYIVDWDNVTERLAKDMKAKQMLAALDGSSVCVMIADTDLKPNYLNKKLTQSFVEWEPELQKVFGPGFRSDAVLGKCIDDYHKNPAHQRKMLANESMFPYQTQIQVGPLRIELAVNCIRDESGKVVGYSTEWNDVTARLLEEEDYKSNVKAISDRMEFLRGACATDLANAMEALANGDLTVTLEPKTPLLEIPRQPDLALMAETFNALRNQTVKSVEGYNKAQQSLGALIAQAQIAVTNIADASNEVMTGNDDLAQRTEEQAASLEETASSMEEMTSTVKQNADNAKQANQLAMQARELAEKGGQVVNNAVTTMGEINVASKRIADIISVIDEIAFQTNLLALNAAVEAARVGEQGRGFAVVAAEVRNLAGRSATAAKEIKGLVQDSVQKVQEGSSLVNQSGTQLDEIVTSVKKVADIIAEITAAAQEQSAGIEQVNRAIVQMDQITQQNAALVEEASAASQSMNRQASDLQTVIVKFEIDETFVAQLQSKLQAEQAAAGVAAKRASRPEPARPARADARAPRPTKAVAASAGSKQSAGDLDDFEEF